MYFERCIFTNITLDHSLKLIDSRHPVVERVIKDNYVENDMLFVESKTSIEIRYELQDNNKVVFIEN